MVGCLLVLVGDAPAKTPISRKLLGIENFHTGIQLVGVSVEHFGTPLII